MSRSFVTVACASMQSIYLIVHYSYSYLFFLFFSVHEICISGKLFEVYHFLFVSVSCIIEMTMWNSSMVFLVIDDTVETIGQFW